MLDIDPEPSIHFAHDRRRLRVYDFTNYSTLRQWPFVLMLVEVAWGAVASAASAVTVRLAVQ